MKKILIVLFLTLPYLSNAQLVSNLIKLLN